MLDSLPTSAPPTRHAVTAIIVAHDGARLLPGLVRALGTQTHPVEQTIGVDTGSGDRSGAVLGELIGPASVAGMPRTAGFGEAVAVGFRQATRLRPEATDPSLTRAEWIWLLHDDCEPEPEALERLLRAAGKDRSAVILGPKMLDGQDRRTLREAGVSIDRAGRRVTGIDPGEIDQGQHDHKRDVLAVGSAGMLVRRDVWERLGGFDPALRLFRDDVDFCWRAQAAGFRVRVVTDAVLYHRELAARRRRPAAGSSARRLDRTNALFVLAVNLPLLTMLWVVGGCMLGSLARAFYFLLTKQLDQSAAYAYSVANLFLHPIRLLQGRRRRSRGMVEGYNAVRVFIPPARTLRRVAENIAGLISNGPPPASGGQHQASSEESEENEQFVDTQSVLRRVIGHPGVQLFTALLLIALVAERRLLGSNPLGGGALVPVWGGASALWQEYLAGFHAVSVGSTASAPPYLAVVAALGSVLGGQAWLAVDVLLLGCVPLAGLSAYVAARWLVTAAPARVLLAACYALLPVATGTVAAGRLGTAVAFILLPLIAVSAGRMLTAAPRQAHRAAWAAGLLIGLAAAFAPLVWILGTLFALGAVATRRWLIAVSPVNAAIVAVTPFFVLFPWSLHLLSSPVAFLSEAGLSNPALTTRGLPATDLLALSPGGPGLPQAWVTLGFALALAAAVVPARRTGVVIAGWAVAVAGLLTAAVVSRISVTPAGGGQAASAWPGAALALAALGLLVAAAPLAQRLTDFITARGAATPGEPGRPLRRWLAVTALAASATAPLLVAAYWLDDGVRGPVAPVTTPVLPAFVSASSTSGAQYRTLILRPDGNGTLDYTVVRQDDPTLGEPELATASTAGSALTQTVAALGAPNGADAGDPGTSLGEFGIRWVLLTGPVDPVLAQRLDAAIGLVALSKAPGYDLWQVAGTVARARVVAAGGTVTALSSGTVDLAGAAVPASGGTLILAEPYGGWTAKVDGHPLKPLAKPVNGWAQGFALPSGGGRLTISRNNLARQLSLFVELIAVVAVFLLALPGKRTDPAAEAQALAALREQRSGRAGARGTARRAGSRAAGASATGTPTPTGGPGEGELSGSFAVPAGAGGATEDSRAAAAGPGDDDASSAWLDTDPFAADSSTAPSRSFAPRESFAPAEHAELSEPAEPDWTSATGPFAAFRASAEPGPPTRPSLFEGSGSATRPSPSAAEGLSEPWDMAGEPWDMAGDWGSGRAAGARGAWAAGPLDNPVRADDEPASARDDDLRPARAGEDAPAGEDGSERPPWESGPQDPVPPIGDQRYPWDSGPQDPVPSAGGRPRHSRASGPHEFVSPTTAQAGYPWDRVPQDPVPGGGQRSPGENEAQPSEARATPDAGRAPWETGTWDAAPAETPESPELPDPAQGTGPRPAAVPARPERHPHRAKHGKPSRWQGRGRSGQDGGA